MNLPANRFFVDHLLMVGGTLIPGFYGSEYMTDCVYRNVT